MKKILAIIPDIFLFILCIGAGICLVVIMLPRLLAGRKKPPRFYDSRANRLLLLSEGASYDALVKKGNLSLLNTHLCGGYFEKIYVVHFPAVRNQRIRLSETLDIIEISSAARSLKRFGFIFSYTLINIVWYFLNIFAMRKFVTENITVIRGAGVHHTAVAALFLRCLTGIPACVSVHSDDDKRYRLMKGYGSFWRLFNLRWLTVQVHKFVFSHAPMILLVRESLKDWAIRMGAVPKRIRLFPHGIKIDDFAEDNNAYAALDPQLSSRKIILFAGRLSRENYVEDIIKIAALVSQEVSESLFLIVGDGPERGALEGLSDKEKLNRYIRFLDFQDHKKVLYLRRRVDVNLCLMGGFSLIEAALSGKPVVSYDVEWHHELVRNGETGFLVREHDTQAAAEAILTLIDDPALAERLGRNARRLAAERHDITRTDSIKVRAYEELKHCVI